MGLEDANYLFFLFPSSTQPRPSYTPPARDRGSMKWGVRA